MFRFCPLRMHIEQELDIALMNLVDERELLVVLISPHVIICSTQLPEGI